MNYTKFCKSFEGAGKLMISEDEYSQGSQPVDVEPEEDDDMKSKIHEDDERSI
jgi:hypothetical protein